jgi:pyruvate dehydrogenase E2 component (dihydrolipoamide acetyltransferase)
MEFILPNIGEGIETMSISEILVKENQTVKAEQSVLLVETDKASMEIPIDRSCTIKKILVNVGDLISPGQNILEIEDVNTPKVNKDTIIENIDNKQNIIENDQHTSKEKNNTNSQNESIKKSNKGYRASPTIRKLARELNCNIDEVIGTGPNNRILKDDIYNHLHKNPIEENSDNQEMSKSKTLFNAMSKYGMVEKIQLNSIQSITSDRLYNSWRSIPHVTQFDEVDITELDRIVKILKKVNKHEDSKVSYLPFFIKAVAIILEKLNKFNSSLDEDNKSILQKQYYNIGIAVDTPKGLLVPVIKNVNTKSIKSITIEFNKIVKKARENKLTIEEMSGGCITISSLGNIGGNFFTPIINPPEVSILGISKIYIKPVLINNSFKARKVLPISLSYDHRVINGADAANFTVLFSKLIENPSKL